MEGMSEVDESRLLEEVRSAAETIRISENVAREARERRAEAIRAADDAGVPREDIAAAAGVQWPMSRQRWSQLRLGNMTSTEWMERVRR